MGPRLQRFVFGASCNRVRGALPCNVLLGGLGEGALEPSCFLSGSSLRCSPVFLPPSDRQGRARSSLQNSGPPFATWQGWVCGAGDTGAGKKKEMQCGCSSPPPLEYLGHSPSACWSEHWEAFVVQIRDLFLFLLFSFPSYPPPSKGYCFSSLVTCIDNPWKKGVLRRWDIWVFCVKRQDGHFLCLVSCHWPHHSELYLTVWQLMVPSFPFLKLISPFLSVSIRPLCLRSS